MIQTLPGLIKQTVEALREFSDLFRIIVLHSDPSVIAGREIFVVSKIPNDHTIWDTRDRTNIRTIIVTSFNTATSQYGPTAFNARKLSQDAHWQVPKEQAWVNNPKGRVRGMILDEAHYGFRNETSFTETVKWFKPPVLWMFSGSPAPRGLQDWISYLSLIENDELAGKGEFPDDSCGYKPDEDPYLLDDSHPAVKYRYTAFAFRKWIVENKHISECEKVIKAQSVLKHFVLRRDYTAACPLGSDRTIARGLPPLHHYAVERLFSPTSQDLYNKFIKQWSRRLALKPNEGGFKHPIPNPRAVRAMTLITMVPILGYLHKANPEYRPPPKKDDEYYVPYAQKLIKKNANNDQDWLSRFNEDSTLWKSMPGVGKDLRRWRWILNTVISEGCTEIPRRNYQDTKGVLTKDVLHVILQHSPKIEALLSVVAEHALLRDNKIILWFSYPITQSLIVEILMSWKYTDAISDSLHSGTPQKRRDELQADMNSPNATIRILAASMHCRGVGLNLQKDSHVCMMFEAASTLDMELQVISRQHRLGQLYPVTVYSVVMLNTIDEKFVR
jgi:SNF2 family DNA or RNA helicase